MAVIKAKVKDFTGTQFSVDFVNGVGETNDAYLISRFKNKGYEVEEPKKKTTAKKDE